GRLGAPRSFVRGSRLPAARLRAPPRPAGAPRWLLVDSSGAPRPRSLILASPTPATVPRGASGHPARLSTAASLLRLCGSCPRTIGAVPSPDGRAPVFSPDGLG